MRKPINPAFESHALFFSPAYMQMRPTPNAGPKHYPTPPGVSADYDGNVTFCLLAPNAQSAGVSGIGGSFSEEIIPMERGEEGYWTVEVHGVAPGFHYCRFYVDGNAVTNPQAPFGYGCHETINFFEVPDRDDDSWTCKDVPHGSLHMELYRSSRTGTMQSCWIYTPPSYHSESDRRYPVLYLHHGGGENETGWIWQGKINYIADNLIAEGACQDMIIVMPCMYDIRYEAPDDFMAGDYDALLTHDCMPMVEERYRVMPDGAHRAIGGLSMGSYHSAQISCNHPGMFAYTAMLSGSFDDRWYRWVNCRDVISKDARFRAETRLFFMGVGTDEARIYAQVRENMDFLRANGVACEYFECPGYHEWTVWRKSVRRFLTMIFR